MKQSLQEKLSRLAGMEPGQFTLLYSDDKGMEAFSFFCLADDPSWEVSEIFLYLLRLYKADYKDSDDESLKLINKDSKGFSDLMKFLRSEFFLLYMNSKNYQYVKVRIFIGNTKQEGKATEIVLLDPCDLYILFIHKSILLKHSNSPSKMASIYNAN